MNLTPNHPHRWAALVFVIAVALLCWPMLFGQYLVGPFSDQYMVGFAFREFLADHLREYGEIPLWNPYIFGGLPFIGAGHGDVFYPTSWLRLLVGTDTGLNLTYAIHLFLAGFATYLFLRSFRFDWLPSVIGGVAYALTGQVASLVHPGHDGKLIVSSLLPLGLWALTRAIRDGRPWAYPTWALVVGLALLSPHPQLSYYLLIGSGIFALYLTFWDSNGPQGRHWPIPLALALASVLVGVGLSMPQYLPMLEHIPFSPRSLPGSAFSGYGYATSFSMPPEELLNTVLPQFSGLITDYWGRNPLKFHTEYLGVGTMVLALLGWGNRERRRLWWGLTAMAGVLLVVSLGGYTPIYRIFYAAFPGMKFFRAPSTAFFVVAFAVAGWAAIGVERLARKPAVGIKVALIASGVLIGAALLGVLGVWTAVGETIVQSGPIPQRVALVDANRTHLVLGALRGAVVAAALAAVLILLTRQRLPALAGAGILLAIVTLDLWSVDRRFFVFSPPAEELYRTDSVILALDTLPKPNRILHPGGAYRDGSLMGFGLQEVLGHHGNEISYYDELLGGKNRWTYLLNGSTGPKLWRELAVSYQVWPQQIELPGFELAAGPVTTFTGQSAYLYRAQEPAPYAVVVPAAIKLPDDQILGTFYRPDFDATRLVLLPDDAAVDPAPLNELPPPSSSAATVTEWRPGAMTVRIDPAPTEPAYVRISESFYPSWRARVDGIDATVVRGNYALITVPVPAGASEITLEYRSASYERGKLIAIIALLLLAVAFAGAWMMSRRGSSA